MSCALCGPSSCLLPGWPVPSVGVGSPPSRGSSLRRLGSRRSISVIGGRPAGSSRRIGSERGRFMRQAGSTARRLAAVAQRRSRVCDRLSTAQSRRDGQIDPRPTADPTRPQPLLGRVLVRERASHDRRPVDNGLSRRWRALQPALPALRSVSPAVRRIGSPDRRSELARTPKRIGRCIACGRLARRWCSKRIVPSGRFVGGNRLCSDGPGHRTQRIRIRVGRRKSRLRNRFERRG